MLDTNDLSIGILAGGKATRMNNKDKGLINLKGKPFVERLIEIIKPHTSNIIINANRNISEYEKYGYPVIRDEMEDFQGPLSGIYSMLKSSSSKYLFALPCDCPNFKWEVIEFFMKNLLLYSMLNFVFYEIDVMAFVINLTYCLFLDQKLRLLIN